MKLQKIILCAAIALTAFGASLGLLEIGSYLRAALLPVIKVEIKPLEPFESPVYAPARRPELKEPVSTPTEESKPEVESEYWDKIGYYYIVGDNPKGFANFEWLEISTYKYDDKLGKVVAVKLSGSITTKKRNFNLTKIDITGNCISIVTETQKGIVFKFDGKFVEEEEVKYKDEDGEETTDKALLKGRLTKWRNGVKIAESAVKLGYTVGC
jgi:hypothetical protein